MSTEHGGGRDQDGEQDDEDPAADGGAVLVAGDVQDPVGGVTHRWRSWSSRGAG